MTGLSVDILRACAGRVSLMVLGLMSMTSVQAASFDCAKASRPLETLICQNPQLDEADTRMGQAYRHARKTFPIPDFVQATQRSFVSGYGYCLLNGSGAQADNSTAVKQCLADVQARTHELEQWAGAQVYSDVQGTYSPENLVILVFMQSSSPARIQLWGNWMPDAYRPKPFPNGSVCNLQGDLLPQGGAVFTTEDTQDVRLTITPDAVTIDDFISCTPRTGIAQGVYPRVPFPTTTKEHQR